MFLHLEKMFSNEPGAIIHGYSDTNMVDIVKQYGDRQQPMSDEVYCNKMFLYYCL